MANGRIWRGFLAVLLCFIFLFLNVAVEFSHQHGSVVSSKKSFSKIKSEAKLLGKNHSLICKACWFGLAHLAPEISFLTLKVEQNPRFGILEELIIYFEVHPVSYHLRAPPATLL